MKHRITRTLAAQFGSLAAAAAAALALVAAPVTINAPEAKADVCPAVVVVAARGSGQNDQFQTWYSNQAAYASNGWEGATIRAMLRTVESRYTATHGGNSAMKDVYVMGLSPQDYPATFPDYFVPDVAAPTTIGQVLGLVSVWTQPVLNMAFAAANQFSYSVQTGRSGVMNAINGYEAASGCRPQYILAGYSQGAMILAEHEKELAGRGQLAGVVYLGNALTAKGDPFTVGNTTGQGGILGWLPTNTVGSKGTDNRVNYCLPADGVCDLSIPTLQAASATGGDHGRYFLQGSQWDTQVADSIGSWIDQARYR